MRLFLVYADVFDKLRAVHFLGRGVIKLCVVRGDGKTFLSPEVWFLLNMNKWIWLVMTGGRIRVGVCEGFPIA